MFNGENNKSQIINFLAAESASGGEGGKQLSGLWKVNSARQAFLKHYS